MTVLVILWGWWLNQDKGATVRSLSCKYYYCQEYYTISMKYGVRIVLLAEYMEGNSYLFLLVCADPGTTTPRTYIQSMYHCYWYAWNMPPTIHRTLFCFMSATSTHCVHQCVSLLSRNIIASESGIKWTISYSWHKLFMWTLHLDNIYQPRPPPFSPISSGVGCNPPASSIANKDKSST